jgi:hypothetical protein
MKLHFNAMTVGAALVALSLIGGTALAQHEQHGGQRPTSQGNPPGQPPPQQHQQQGHDRSAMMQEPHHLLAMAHHESMAAFARALNQHAAGKAAFHGEFARDAVAEIRRNFDQMTRHHQEHLQTTQMEAMMKQMESHQAQLRTQLEALERETGGDRPDRQRITQHAAEFVKHLDEMSKLHGGHAGHHK